jgi:fructuronate reductase
VVVDPKIINPREFIDVVIKTRLPNPFMPDSPQRIATDTSQKVPIRFGETIKAYLAGKAGDKTVDDLILIPLVLAAWLRYLMGVDDDVIPFEMAPAPLYTSLIPILARINLGYKGHVNAVLIPILSNSKIFGVDLYKAGLGERIESYFSELIYTTGAVAATLQKYIDTPS